jgi:DNA-binding CsgD family transcriptional regulator
MGNPTNNKIGDDGFTRLQREVYELMKQGLDNKEISEKLKISDSAARHRRLTINNILKKNGAVPIVNLSNSTKPEFIPDENYSELNILRQDNVRLKKELYNLKKTSQYDQYVIDVFEKHCIKHKPVSRIKVKKPDRHRVTEEAILLLSDIHAGEVVSSEAMMNMNEYNFDIMQSRLENVYNNFNSVIDKMTGYNYKKLNIFALGDLVSGSIHQELVITGGDIVDQVLITSDIIAEMVHKWSGRFDEIEFSGVIGNHGRRTERPSYKRPHNNDDYYLMQFVKAKCTDLPNVKFDLPKASMHMKQIQGHWFLLTHGDCVTSRLGIPWYGIRRLDSNISQTIMEKLGRKLHAIGLGHFHTRGTLEKIGGQIILNGSLKGGDEFSIGRIFVCGVPSQTFISVHKDWGVNSVRPIWAETKLGVI